MYYNLCLCIHDVMGNIFRRLTHNSLFHKLESIQLKHLLIFNPLLGRYAAKFPFYWAPVSTIGDNAPFILQL